MYDADAIEAINFEQLATLTDRMLLRGRAAKQWPAIPSLVANGAPVASPARRLAHGSQIGIDTRTVRARIEQARIEQARIEQAQRAQPRAKPSRAQAKVAATLGRSANGFELSSAERTVCVRSSPASRAEVLTITVVIPTLLGIATGLAALLIL